MEYASSIGTQSTAATTSLHSRNALGRMKPDASIPTGCKIVFAHLKPYFQAWALPPALHPVTKFARR